MDTKNIAKQVEEWAKERYPIDGKAGNEDNVIAQQAYIMGCCKADSYPIPSDFETVRRLEELEKWMEKDGVFLRYADGTPRVQLVEGLIEECNYLLQQVTLRRIGLKRILLNLEK